MTKRSRLFCVFCLLEILPFKVTLWAQDQFTLSVDERIEFILTHEFSHPYVNPLVKRYERQLTSAVTLSDSAKVIMRRNAYSTNWNPIEHMVRAITAIYFQRTYGDDVAQRELKHQRENWGFEYIEEVYQLYQQYLEDKEHYATFEAFFPVIVAHFTEESHAR